MKLSIILCCYEKINIHTFSESVVQSDHDDWSKFRRAQNTGTAYIDNYEDYFKGLSAFLLICVAKKTTFTDIIWSQPLIKGWHLFHFYTNGLKWEDIWGVNVSAGTYPSVHKQLHMGYVET